MAKELNDVCEVRIFWISFKSVPQDDFGSPIALWKFVAVLRWIAFWRYWRRRDQAFSFSLKRLRSNLCSMCDESFVCAFCTENMEETRDKKDSPQLFFWYIGLRVKPKSWTVQKATCRCHRNLMTLMERKTSCLSNWVHQPHQLHHRCVLNCRHHWWAFFFRKKDDKVRHQGYWYSEGSYLFAFREIKTLCPLLSVPKSWKMFWDTAAWIKRSPVVIWTLLQTS